MESRLGESPRLRVLGINPLEKRISVSHPKREVCEECNSSHSPGIERLPQVVADLIKIGPAESRNRPRVTIHGQTYLLARGPLRSAHWIGDWRGDKEAFLSEPPLIWWPNERAWCVGSLMDIDSTVIGGSASLIQDLLDDSRLEVLPVQANDSLMYDADRVNK